MTNSTILGYLKIKKSYLGLLVFMFPWILMSQSTYPIEFQLDYYKEASNAISEEKEFGPNVSKVFYEELYETKRNMFYNNSVYFEDEYTGLVNKIADNLLVSDEELKDDLNIYVTRFASRNAFALPDGSLFINIGLIAAVDNEAQLAFIIAHEIGHYKNQHSRQSINRLLMLEEEQKNAENIRGNYFRKMRYSREHEFESDGYALALMKSANYDASESMNSLDLLIDSLDFKLKEEDIIDMLSSDLFQLDSNHFIKYNKKRQKSGERLVIKDDNDLLSSHPSMSKRTLALKEIMEAMPEEYKGGSKFLAMQEAEFQKMLERAQQEMISNLFDRSEYISSLMLSLEALLQDRDDQFMRMNVVRNLYQLAYFKEIEGLNDVLEMNTLGNADIMMKIKGFASEISFDEMRKMTFGYTKRELQTIDNDEELLFYHGLITKSYLGKEPARLIFNKYKAAYPNGKYVTYINTL